MGDAIRLVALTVGLAGLGWGCVESPPFTCGADVECGDSGTCQPNGLCSFVAPGCESGQAYGDASPMNFAGLCVPVAGEDGLTSGDSEGGGGTRATSSAGSTGDGVSTTFAVDLDSSGVGSDSTGDTDTGGSTRGADSSDGEASSSDTRSPLDRVTDGILVLYRFDAGVGLAVDDVSGVDPLMPLTIAQEQGSPSWGPDGLFFDGGGIAAVLGSSTKLRLGIQTTEAFTLEIWVTPTDVVQTGPPRLLTLSRNAGERSFSLTHGGLDFGDEYAVRLQSEGTGNSNGLPIIITPSIVELLPTHVVVSRTASGSLELWVDGVLILDELRTGDFDGWPLDHTFAVGNEVTLGRGYFGTVHLAAIYDRALAWPEIAQNYSAGY